MRAGRNAVFWEPGVVTSIILPELLETSGIRLASYQCVQIWQKDCDLSAEDLVPICNTAAEWGARQRFMQDALVRPLLGVCPMRLTLRWMYSPASRVIWYPRFQEPGVLLLLTGVAWIETRYIISPALRSDARVGRCLPRIKPLSISSKRVSGH